MASSDHGKGNLVLWLLIALYLVDPVLTDAFPRTLASPLNTPIAIVLPLLFGLLHGARRYGWRGILVFLVLCLAISNVMENLGVLTGFPFGRYHYTDVLGPKLFLVPLLIGPAYFGASYVSWVLATILLDADRRRDVRAVVGVPLVGTFIMVALGRRPRPRLLDLRQDLDLGKGGGFFGVPFVNYLGWYLTVFLFLQAFSLYNARRGHRHPICPRHTGIRRRLSTTAMALDFVAGYAGARDQAITDATGKVWQAGDLFATAGVMGLFVMLPWAVASTAVLMMRGASRDAERT
jgi:putative membrane protein